MRGPPEPATASTNGASGSTGLSERFLACAARNRKIGQRGSQTETMRDMIVLHHPFPGASVAAALEREPPARARDQAEAVARGGRRADPPARRRGASPLPPPPHAGEGREGAGRSSKSGSPQSAAARCSL